MAIPIQTLSFCKTDPGIRRSCNEDACLIHNDGGYFLVADGIGGAAAGEIASAIFAKTAGTIFSASGASRSLAEALETVKQCFLKANSEILADAAATPSRNGMGCTAELLALHADGFVLGHVGDSRTYRLRNGVLSQLTKDHSLVQQQLDEGLIDRERAQNHPMKNVILRAVGIDEQVAVDIIQGQVHPGDLFLLCTDGLSDMLDDQRIQDALTAEGNLEDMAKNLIDLANAAGGRDNISVTLVKIL